MLHRINHNVKHVFYYNVYYFNLCAGKTCSLAVIAGCAVFGLIMNNNLLFKNNYSMKIINFEEFNADLNAFKNMAAELTFIVRSFFFILFVFLYQACDLLSLKNLMIASIIVAVIFILRALYLKTILRLPLNPLLYFAPRGLITILLFLRHTSIDVAAHDECRCYLSGHFYNHFDYDLW
jgi:hypothetical protein